MQHEFLRLLLIWRHLVRPVNSAEGASGRKTSPSRRSQPASYGLPSVSSPVFLHFPTRRSKRRDEVAAVTSPGPLHPGQQAGRECRSSVPILRHFIRQQGTIRETATHRWVPANPAWFVGAGPGLPLLTFSAADASWGVPTHPAFRWRCLARKQGATWHPAAAYSLTVISPWGGWKEG